MNPVERTVADASHAHGEIVREIRPLAAGAVRGRRWKAWLAPVTAAAAVVALVTGLLMVRDTPSGGVAPTGPIALTADSTSGVPPYYVALYQSGQGSAGLLVGDTYTGAKLATIAPPAGSRFVGVTGAADDRTFVVSTYPVSRTFHPSLPVMWYLLRIAPGRAPGYRLTRLAIPDVRSWSIQAIALSGSGRELALTALPGAQYLHPSGGVLRIYSVATGKLLRNWSADASLVGGTSFPGFQNQPLSWVDDDRALVFPAYTAGGAQPLPKNTPLMAERMIDVTAKNGDLAAESRLLWAMPRTAGPRAPRGCQPDSARVASGGKTVACVTYPKWANGDNNHATLAWLTYATSAPTAPRFLYQVTVTGPFAHFSSAVVLRADESGGTLLIAWFNGGAVVAPYARFGVISHGRFRPLRPVYLSGSMPEWPVVAW